MATEKQLQEGIQTLLMTLDYFADDDVAINDWGLLDVSQSRAPFAIIFTADEWANAQTVRTPETSYNIPVMLICALSSRPWKTAYDELRDARQAINDLFNNPENTARSAGGIDGVNIREIRPLSEIIYIWPEGTDPDFVADSTPEFIAQIMGFFVEQF